MTPELVETEVDEVMDGLVDDPLVKEIDEYNIRKNKFLVYPLTTEQETITIKKWNNYDFISEWISYFEERSDVNIQYVRSTAYFTISSLIGNYYTILPPNKPPENANIWLFHIGPSQRSRKSFISGSTDRFMRLVGLEDSILPDEFTTVGFKKELNGDNDIIQSKYRRGIWRRNDGANFFTSEKLKYMIGASEFLCNLFDGIATKYRKSEEEIEIPPIHFNLYINAPSLASDYISYENFRSGLLNRMSFSYPESLGKIKPYMDIPDEKRNDDENVIDSDDNVDFETDNNGRKMIAYAQDLHRVIQWRAIREGEKIKMKFTWAAGNRIHEHETKSNKEADIVDENNPIYAGYLRSSTRRLIKAAAINALITDPWPVDHMIKIKEINVLDAIHDIIIPELEGCKQVLKDLTENPTTIKEKIDRKNLQNIMKYIPKDEVIEASELMRLSHLKASEFWKDYIRTLAERNDIVVFQYVDKKKRYISTMDYFNIIVENEHDEIVKINSMSLRHS